MRGQVAIEFLTTYGWAMLLLVIVIGVIISSFSPAFLVQEQCNVDQNNLPCNAQVYNDGSDFVVAVRFVNGFGYPIQIDANGIKLNDLDGNAAYQVDAPSGEIKAGETFDIEAYFSETKESGSLETIQINVTYKSCAQEINPNCDNSGSIDPHTKTGKIIGIVLDA